MSARPAAPVAVVAGGLLLALSGCRTPPPAGPGGRGPGLAIVIDQPVDQPDEADNDAESGAGQPGGPELPHTGTTATVIAAIAGLLLAIGFALTGAGRRGRQSTR